MSDSQCAVPQLLMGTSGSLLLLLLLLLLLGVVVVSLVAAPPPAASGTCLCDSKLLLPAGGASAGGPSAAAAAAEWRRIAAFARASAVCPMEATPGMHVLYTAALRHSELNTRRPPVSSENSWLSTSLDSALSLLSRCCNGADADAV
jgi:hypothetical protein